MTINIIIAITKLSNMTNVLPVSHKGTRVALTERFSLCSKQVRCVYREVLIDKIRCPHTFHFVFALIFIIATLCISSVCCFSVVFQCVVPYIMFQCVDKPTRCNTSYEWSLLSINWLYMFRTITSPSSGASSHKLYNALICPCRRVWLLCGCTGMLCRRV